MYPLIGNSYKSPLLLDDSVELELKDFAFVFPFLATYLEEDAYLGGIIHEF